jgi:hypothetical protein
LTLKISRAEGLLEKSLSPFSITGHYYSLLTKLQAKIVETCLGKLFKLIQDNAPAPKSPVALQKSMKSIIKAPTIQHTLSISSTQKSLKRTKIYVKRVLIDALNT